jgi:hypothetical protein
LRLENLEINIPSDLGDITELANQGIKIRTLIERTINKNVVKILKDHYQKRVVLGRFDGVLLKYDEIIKEKRRPIRQTFLMY